MLGTTDVDRIIGAEVVDPNNDKVGKVSQVYLDADSNNPTWVSVKTGLFGTHESLVPIDDASFTNDGLRVGVDKAQVKDAPRVAPDQELSPEEQDRLYSYYHRGGTAGYGDTTTGGFTGDRDRTYSDTVDDRTTTGTTGGGYDRVGNDTVTGRTGVGHDTSGPNTDDAMTRSEERMNVGVQRVETGRARIRKYIVTEQQTFSVPVAHEEVRVEREPITDANIGAATSGPNLSEEEHVVDLEAERVVVNKETVPVERIRLDKEVVTENQQVSEELRKEQIEVDTDGVGRGGIGTDRDGFGTDRDKPGLVDRAKDALSRDHDGVGTDRTGTDRTGTDGKPGLIDRAKDALTHDRDGDRRV